jgi:pimeloyl-ACP methyl ester carboxylesterase
MDPTRIIELSDGRGLAYAEYGDPHGSPVLSCHGGLSSRLDAAPADEAAKQLGIRLISPDRPGIGLSNHLPGRTLLDWPKDVAELADALDLDRFAVMGWSLGGAFAAVTAARLPERTTKVALLSSAIPLDAFGSTRGLTTDDRVLLFLTHHAPRIASAVMRFTIADASDTRLYREVLRGFPKVDRQVLKEQPDPRQAVAFIKEGMRQGTEGSLQDYRIFGAPWGFELEEIEAPVHIWEGTDDHTGPPEYREFLKRHISHATITLVPHEGHLSLLPHHAAEILGDLVSETVADEAPSDL